MKKAVWPQHIRDLAEAMYAATRPIANERDDADYPPFAEASERSRFHWHTLAEVAWHLGARPPRRDAA